MQMVQNALKSMVVEFTAQISFSYGFMGLFALLVDGCPVSWFKAMKD